MSKQSIAILMVLSSCATGFYVYAFANLKNHPIEPVAVEGFVADEDALTFAKEVAHSDSGKDALFELVAAKNNPPSR